MNRVDALNRVVGYCGGSIRATAKALGVSRQTIHRWARDGFTDLWACRIQLMTNGAIRREDLRPDLGPLPTLPQSLVTGLPRGPKSPLLTDTYRAIDASLQEPVGA